MVPALIDLIDFDKVDTLLEGFNKTTGFVTAILDLEGNVLSKSGWRQICTEFHRINPETSKRCTISDTVLANKLAAGEKYHFYQCMNGLVDVAVPIVIKGQHIANLFSGQFFFEEPDESFFQQQATKFGFNKENYRDALKKVPVVSKEKVIVAMDFLLNMTQMISEISFQKMEQMELNEVIRKSENLLQLFVEHSPASIAMFDNNMRYLVASKRFLADYSLGDQVIIGRSHYDVFPEISDLWKEFHRRGLAGESLKEDNEAFPRADGKTDWVRWEILPWYESENQIGGIILFSEVITAQVEDQQALKESEKYNRMLFEQSAIGLALASLDGKLADINPTFAAIVGCTVEEVRELSYWEITPKKYKEQEDVQLESLAKTGKYGPYEKEYIHKDGHLVPVRLQGSIIERNNEKFIWSSVEDISEQKKTELDLIAAKEQLSQILERINDGFGSLDRDWNYIYVNEKLAQNVGRKREDLLGHNIWEVFPEAIGTDVHKAYLRAMEEQVTIDLEYFYPHLDKWFQHRFYPSPDGLSVFSKDITESKLAEEKIKEHSSLVRIAAEKAKLGGWFVDLKENRSYWSDEVAAIHEMPPGHAPLVEDGINFYAPEWRDRITKVFTDCANKGIPYDEEMEIITSTGRRVWVRTIGEAVKDKNGKIFKVQGAFQDISEKKLAEAKSREKDLQFRKLSANVPDLLFQFTRKPDGTYCVPVASEGIKNIFGCSPEDVVDDFTPIGNVLYPDDAERVIADIEYSAKHLTNFNCEFRVQIPGKPIQWILSSSKPEKLPDGSITWYGFNADITQRKEIENALRESEGKFRKIYEEGPFGMSLVNSEFKFTMANRTFCDITGYSESELRELTFRDITYPDDKDLGIESIRKLIKGEIPVFKSEKRYVRKDGSVIWGAITVAANFDKDGKFLYNLAIVEDITKRRHAENELRKLSRAVEQSPVSIIITDLIGNIEYVNPNFTEITGYTSAEIIGKNPSIIKSGETSPDEYKLLWETIISGNTWHGEFCNRKKNGEHFFESASISPIKDSNGTITHYLAVKEDITKRKVFEEQISKLNENLEQKVLDRTSQLQIANQEMKAFSYSVSHDLRSPLRAIAGFATILEEDYNNLIDEEGKRRLNLITENAKKMGQLIDDLLAFSRLGSAEMNFDKIDMNTLIQKVYDEIVTENERALISFNIQNMPVVNGDIAMLKQVWINLISNAIKFTSHKTVRTIEIGYTSEPHQFIFYIRDNGAGFDMSYSAKLFGVFQRLHSTKEFEGTGIGLALVKQVINRHKGQIWAEGSPDKGATFFFSLPVIPTQNDLFH